MKIYHKKKAYGISEDLNICYCSKLWRDWWCVVSHEYRLVQR